MQPAVVHHGLGEERWEERREVLTWFYRVHPERFVKGEPHPPFLPRSVWINPPKDETPQFPMEKGGLSIKKEPVFVQ
jgi:hypothetical protein